jgi:adenine-specific DNA-methyltransferase
MLRKAEQLFSKIDLTYTLEQANSDFQSWISLQRDFSGGEKAYNRMDEKGDLYQAVSMAWPNNKKAPEDYFVPLIHPVTNKPCPVPAKGWRNPSSTMRELAANKLICFGADETTQPRRKYLLKENMDENIPSLLYYGGSDTDMLTSMGIPFDTPKVVDIVTEHIRSFTKKGDIVLDFFSGSATTAHAVMQSNAEDACKRKFIMVQIPEMINEDTEAFNAGFKNICELGKERIRQAGNRIVEKQADILGMFRANNGDLRNGIAFASFTTSDEAVKRQNEIRQQLDIGFRVLKLDSSTMEDVYYTPGENVKTLLSDHSDILHENIKIDRSPEDLLFQVMLDLGVELSAKIEEKQIDGVNVFFVSYGDGKLIACFDKVNNDILTQIAKEKPYFAVFRDGGFENDAAFVNAEQIFTTYSPETERRVL